MTYRTKVAIMVLIMGYAAGIAFITNTQSIWIFILGILCFLLVNFVLWLETRTVRWHLKVYKRKIYEVLRNLNKFEDPRGSHNASKVESEIADFYGNIGRQIKKSFQIEKQFTQNASHELQTPITVIKTSLESLLQSPNLQENDYKDIEIILSNTNKLSRINQALVLLSRIRSYYNDNVESVNINDVLLNCQQDYEER
ncbi:MAG: HAMP domain-containing histidine kinase, partial [Saprospiraceae bacterium]|nr:HAMP domain-containing histidine kinase [Saprospiraceae bacterium]